MFNPKQKLECLVKKKKNGAIKNGACLTSITFGRSFYPERLGLMARQDVR